MSESSPPGSESSKPSKPSSPQPSKVPPKPREEKSDFRVIRSAPPPESGTNLAPIIALVVVVGIGIAGFVFTRDKTGTTKGNPTTTSATTPTSTEPATMAPDFVTEKIAFYENEQQFERALKYAEEKLKDYPTASDLKAKIKQLRQKLGLDTLANPDEGLRQVVARISARQFPEALESVTAIIEGATLSEPQKARAFFLLATCHANMGNSLDAANALKGAEELGHPAAECAALRDQFKL
jgi:hypothetical protein